MSPPSDSLVSVRGPRAYEVDVRSGGGDPLQSVRRSVPNQCRCGGPRLHARDLATFRSGLERMTGDLTWYSNHFSPYPLVLPRGELVRFSRLRQALHRAFKAVVEAYLDSPRLGRIIALPRRFRRILERCRAHPYRVGSFRPDLLLDEHGEWRVCEINARFPLNAYVVSYHVNRLLSRLDYLQGVEAEPIASLNTMPSMVLARLGLDLGSRSHARPVTLVKSADPGREIDLLMTLLERLGLGHRRCTPHELSVRGAELLAAGEPSGPLILELRRDELLELDDQVIDALLDRGDYFNDLRTLLLVHDKRMLAALTDDAVVRAHVDERDRELLAHHLIPTWNAGAPQISDSLRKEPERWVLKRNSSGRGMGMLLGWRTSAAIWNDALARADEYTAQHYLSQLKLPIVTVERDELCEVPMNVVGLLPGFDHELLGPGFFRVSLDPIINLHGGRGALVPVMVSR